MGAVAAEAEGGREVVAYVVRYGSARGFNGSYRMIEIMAAGRWWWTADRAKAARMSRSEAEEFARYHGNARAVALTRRVRRGP